MKKFLLATIIALFSLTSYCQHQLSEAQRQLFADFVQKKVNEESGQTFACSVHWMQIAFPETKTSQLKLYNRLTTISTNRIVFNKFIYRMMKGKNMADYIDMVNYYTNYILDSDALSSFTASLYVYLHTDISRFK